MILSAACTRAKGNLKIAAARLLRVESNARGPGPAAPALLVAVAAAAAAALLASPALPPGASAHTTVEVGAYEIEAGWGTEPPVVGIRNTLVFEVREPGEREGVSTGVRDAFRDMYATVRFGGAGKEIGVNSAPAPGHYYANIIPTRTGSYSVQFEGEIGGMPVDVEVPVEDVETTAVLDFPPRTGAASGSGSGDPGGDAVWAAIRQLQAGAGGPGIAGVGGSGGAAAPASARGGDPVAYDYAVVALSLGAAGVVLGAVAMARRR